MDIAHVHHPFLSGSLAMRYCVPRNIPVVFTNHTRYALYTQAYLPMLPEQVGEAALKAFMSPFFRACDLIIVPSQSIQQVLEKQMEISTRVEVIPHGVDLSPYRSAPIPVDRHTFGFSEKDIICTYVGRLAPEKNLSFLLRAFNGLASAYDHVCLLMIGDGPDKENLEAQVKQMKLSAKVYFAGMVDYGEIPAHMAASDIFVTPSSTETFGLSTVEAMAAGLPVIGIDAPGTADIIEDGINGLISPDDVAVFTAKLILLATNHDLRRKMASEARQTSEKYDIKITTNRLQEQYQQLVEAARRRRKNPHYQLTRFLDRFQ